MQENKREIQWAFWSIVAAAFLLRAWGIWNVTSTDEYNEVVEALRVASGHFNYERWIKRFYLYILTVEYGFYFIGGWLLKVFSGPWDFAEKIVRNMEPLFLLGRVSSAVAGALTVGVTYRIGRGFFSGPAGVVASFLLTVSVFHIELSQQAKVDALQALLVTATFYFLLKILSQEDPGGWDYGWCGLFMALAIQTKINSIVLGFPFIITLLLRKNVQKRHSLLLYFVPLFLVGFVLGNPPVLLAPERWVKGILGLRSIYSTPGNVVPNDIIGWFAYPLYYFRYMGGPISILTLVSIIWACCRLNERRGVVLSFILAFYLLMGSNGNLVAPYYLIPVAPFIYLIVGDSLTEMGQILERSWKSLPALKPLLLIGLAVITLEVPIRLVTYHELSLSGKNTRFLAGEWIEKNIPVGSRILMDSGKSINSFAPAIAENRVTVERMLETARKNIARGVILQDIVDENSLVYYELLRRTVPQVSFEITSTMFGLEVRPMDYYSANGFEYFVISKIIRESRMNSYFEERHPEVAEFYKSLATDDRVKLIQTIQPSLTHRGDTFYIYSLANRDSGTGG